MTTNITPEDREIWDKKMREHSRRLSRQEKRGTIGRVIVAALIMALSFAIAYNWSHKPYTPPRTPEQVMEDTLVGVKGGDSI